jgi:hypothetical protein
LITPHSVSITNQHFQVSFTASPVMPNCLPHRHIIERPPLLFVPQCGRPGSTPIQNDEAEWYCVNLVVACWIIGREDTNLNRPVATSIVCILLCSSFVRAYDYYCDCHLFDLWHVFK